MPPNTYCSPELAFIEAVKLSSASSPVLLRLKSAEEFGDHCTRLCNVDCAVLRMESMAVEAVDSEPAVSALAAVKVASRSS